MKDYSAMSDFDIQQAVLHETWGKHPVRLLGKMMLDIMLSDYDPCNNPADAWPIILSKGISLMFDGVWQACAGLTMDSGGLIGWDYYCSDAKPLKAAMIVYLQMMEQK